MDLGLQVNTKKTDSGLYEITYALPRVPFDVQEAAFTANGLHNVSPAELAFLRVNVSDDTFDPYSRTQGRVIHDNRDGGRGFVVFPNGLGTLVRTADIVIAHMHRNEYIIPSGQKASFYDLIDAAIRNNVAVRVGYDQTDVPIDRFGEEELSSILYADSLLGAKAQDYGDHIREKGQQQQSFFFDGKDYAMQNGLYVNGLRLFGPDVIFDVDGDVRDLVDYDCAFGVSFKKIAEGDAKKS